MRPVTAIICAFLFLNSVLVVRTVSPSGQRPAWYLEELSLDNSSCMYAYINTTYINNGVVYSDNTESGRYGETYVGPAYGVLIHVRSGSNNDPTACTLPLITSSTQDGTLPVSEPWIALIKRGECDFGVKVKNAVLSNASAVLVYNDLETSSGLEKMRIPSDLSEYPYIGTTLSIFSILYSIRTLVNVHSFVTFFLNLDKI